MFQFHQNNSQLLFHVIVSPWGAGAFSRGFTKILARQCRAFSRALKIEKLKAPLFPGPGGAGDANDWCITWESVHNEYYFHLTQQLYKALYCLDVQGVHKMSLYQESCLWGLGLGLSKPQNNVRSLQF